MRNFRKFKVGRDWIFGLFVKVEVGRIGGKLRFSSGMFDLVFPGGSTPYNGLYGEAPPERSTFFRLQVYKMVGISQVEVSKRVEKSVIFLIDVPYGCIILFIKHYMIMKTRA